MVLSRINNSNQTGTLIIKKMPWRQSSDVLTRQCAYHLLNSPAIFQHIVYKLTDRNPIGINNVCAKAHEMRLLWSHLIYAEDIFRWIKEDAILRASGLAARCADTIWHVPGRPPHNAGAREMAICLDREFTQMFGLLGDVAARAKNIARMRMSWGGTII